MIVIIGCCINFLLFDEGVVMFCVNVFVCVVVGIGVIEIIFVFGVFIFFILNNIFCFVVLVNFKFNVVILFEKFKFVVVGVWVIWVL